jgi:hypothetical protein
VRIKEVPWSKIGANVRGYVRDTIPPDSGMKVDRFQYLTWLQRTQSITGDHGG